MNIYVALNMSSVLVTVMHSVLVLVFIGIIVKIVYKSKKNK